MGRRAHFSSEGGAEQRDEEGVTEGIIEGSWNPCSQGIHNSMLGVNGALSEVGWGDDTQ